MLNPTEVHYLVGLLTQVSEASDIEIELGDRVYDEAAEEERDIDVTATRKNPDGTLSVFKGIEVKKHTKPLTVIHVEQLCLKFMDMPQITHRAIVSASGYTEAAVKKAKVHKVDLFEIVDWENPQAGFEHVQIPKDIFSITEINPQWDGQPHVQANLNEPDLQKIKAGDNPQIVDIQGNNFPGVPDFTLLVQQVATNTLNAIQHLDVFNDIEPNAGSKHIVTNLAPNDGPHFAIGNERIPIVSFTITGNVKRIVTEHAAQFKVMRRLGDDILIAGCAIAEITNGNLGGISVNNSNRNITYLNIPYQDRVRKNVYKQKL